MKSLPGALHLITPAARSPAVEEAADLQVGNEIGYNGG